MSKRACQDKRQTDLLQTVWEESGKVYRYRKLHDDLVDHGETCCPNRVARLTRIAGIRAQIGYKPFFNLFKRARIRRKAYLSWDEARQGYSKDIP